MTQLLEFREHLQNAKTTSEVQIAMEEGFADMGFVQSCYLMFRPPAGHPVPKVLTNFPRGWRDRYIDMDYGKVDAMMPLAGRSLFPIRWDEVFDGQEVTPKQRRIYAEASEFGLKCGITVPIHGPAGGMALISMCGDLSPREFNQIWGSLKDDLTLMATDTHKAVLDCVSQEASLEPISLTEREKECLLWTSQGKTAWEVSNILGITERTVLFHLNNAMAKLRVFSKHHAVVKAIMMGLILP